MKATKCGVSSSNRIIMARFMAIREAVPRQYERGWDPTVEYRPRKMYARFRVDNEALTRLLVIIGPLLPHHEDEQGLPIPPHIMVLVTLSYFATNCFQANIAGEFRISQSTVSRCIGWVTDALVAVRDQLIRWPHAARERERVISGFFNIAGFPNVIAAVDGTHIRINRPVHDEVDYVCRKKYHSINVQAACDHEGIFTHVNAQWPGSTHDSFVMRATDMWQSFEDGAIRGRVLGDSGYRCRPWLLTPYSDPQTEHQRTFNTRHKKTRVHVEMAFGKAKRRFSILGSTVRVKHDRIPAVIVACFSLHNFVTRDGVRARVLRGPRAADDPELPSSGSAGDDDDSDDSDVSSEDGIGSAVNGNHVRDLVVFPPFAVRR
eukprot:GHVU01050169.1.p1 GENE.GHVU01050169.1~~GHVU01050169.1.p1  ORF type:complete len:376 (+),score=23.23 GHVU01050169.1:2811-3938(+)